MVWVQILKDMKLDFPSPLQCNKDTEESSYFMRRKMWEFYLEKGLFFAPGSESAGAWHWYCSSSDEGLMLLLS
uniref:Uncharacterized protein n=1 Tax=Castor canadensis TaxID=51338 RepID=A0A8C0W8H3_CASCN